MARSSSSSSSGSESSRSSGSSSSSGTSGSSGTSSSPSRGRSRSLRSRRDARSGGGDDKPRSAAGEPPAKRASPAADKADKGAADKAAVVPDGPARLHVGHLTRNVTEAHVREIFSHFGKLGGVELAMDRVVNLPR